MNAPDVPLLPDLDKEVAKKFNSMRPEDWTVEDWKDLYIMHQWVAWRVSSRHGFIKVEPHA